MTIVTDETMKMTRQIDTCLNLQKIFTHTPVRSEIEKLNYKLKVPALYVKVLERSVKPIQDSIENAFSVNF